MSFIKKYKKDLLIAVAILIALFTAVLGADWSENADKPFWWRFWIVAAIVAFVACIGGWLYLIYRKK